MIKVLKHLNSKDKRALAAFLGLALLCFLYFASGILVTYVSSPKSPLETAGKGFNVQVLGFQTQESAEILSAALQKRRVPVAIERNPVSQGYMLRAGPFANRGDAESLTNDLHSSGYDNVIIAESHPPGISDRHPDRQSFSPKD